MVNDKLLWAFQKVMPLKEYVQTKQNQQLGDDSAKKKYQYMKCSITILHIAELLPSPLTGFA